MQWEFDVVTATRIFWAIYLVDVLFNLVLYFLGNLAVYTKSFRLMNAYSKIAIAGCIQIIFLTFQRPQYSIPIGLFRVATYLYSKFFAHLILNLLLLPH